jgi:hypothetical protein
MSTHDPDDDDPPRRRRRDEDEDDRPRRPRRDEFDEDDDRPSRASRRRYDDERDDFDDAPARRPSQPGNGMAVASMIVGIVGVLAGLFGWCCCSYFGSGGAILIGTVAVILGFVSRSQGSRSGMNVTGLILGFATILLGVLMTILLIAGFAWIQANQGKFGPGPGQGPGGGGVPVQKKKF